MNDLERGILVQHSTLGLGKVVALEQDAVHVFFPGRGERFAAKLRLPGARAFLRVGIEGRNAWLEGLTSFALDATSGRWALPARWLTLDQAVDQFLAAHPKGFAAAVPGRATTWRAAQKLLADSLGNGEAERLLEAGDLRELVKRMVRIAKLVSPLIGEEERDAAEDALGDDEPSRRFLSALFELMALPSPGRPRFDKLYAAATGLPVGPAARWLLVTLFPFLGRPEKHPLFRPGSTREAAERLGFDLRFEETPNWYTFSALRAQSARLLEVLAPAGARDYVDVEVFAHAASTMRASGSKRASKRVVKLPVSMPAPATVAAKGTSKAAAARAAPPSRHGVGDGGKGARAPKARQHKPVVRDSRRGTRAPTKHRRSR